MKIRLIFLLVCAGSSLGATSGWLKKVNQDSNDSMDVAKASDTEGPDDPEDTTRRNVREAMERTVSGDADERTEKGNDVGGSGDYDIGGTYNMALKIQKLSALARCLESTHDRYYPDGSCGVTSFCIHGYPACLRQLAINPQPDFQILRLRNYPRVLGHFDRAAKARRSFQRAKLIVRELLNQGIMQQWSRLDALEWAKSKVAAWRSSKSGNSIETLGEILQEPPTLFDVCKPSEMPLGRSWKFMTNDCFVKVLSNLLVFEKILREDGATMEMKFHGDNRHVCNLLRAVKSVLEEEKDVTNSGTLDEPKMALTTIIRSMLQDGVLEDDVSNYPWAREFLTKWKSSMTKALNDILEETYYSVEGGIFRQSCRHSRRSYVKVNRNCWRNKIAEIMIVESELMKQGLSLMSISFNKRSHRTLVDLINRVLQEEEHDESFGVNKEPQFRRSATPEKSNLHSLSAALKPGELADLLNSHLHSTHTKGSGTKTEHHEHHQDMKATTVSPTEDKEKGSQRDREQLSKKVATSFDAKLLLDAIDKALGEGLDKSKLEPFDKTKSTTKSPKTSLVKGKPSR